MPDRSKVMTQQKEIPWSSRLGVGLRTLLQNLQRKPKPTKGCSADDNHDIGQ